VQERIAEVEAELPFAIPGFDSDNGGEFINSRRLSESTGTWWTIFVCAKTRSPSPARAYRKNDNARVEQKNWTHVRQLVGYGRLGELAQAELLNALYVQEWNLFRNFFCPVMKHLRTKVEGSRKKRIYDKPATPFARLKASAGLAPEQLARLEALRETLLPFAMKQRIEKKLRRLLNPAAPRLLTAT
jgi:hypothetical protein